MQEKESWNTELEIYKLPRMRHPNILEFLGHEKHTEKIQQEFWLISAYQHNGSLCDYLKSHTVTYKELCKIAESMACGLAHLHEEIFSTKNEGLKPSIAHRDFKSKNVLLKNDLTACIADFGLAMIFQPGELFIFSSLFQISLSCTCNHRAKNNFITLLYIHIVGVMYKGPNSHFFVI